MQKAHAGSGSWTRRQVLQWLGSLAAFQAALPAAAWGSPAAHEEPWSGFAYAASDHVDGARQGIHVFRVQQDRWTPVHFVPSAAPSAMVVSEGGILFVANNIERYGHRPTASVESFRIDPRTGALTLLNRQALALSATHPGHLALSPGGGLLAVAVTGGGAYNLLPVCRDGSLGEVIAIHKEVGCGAHTTLQAMPQPRAIAFDRNGHLLAADLGTDRLSVFDCGEQCLRVVHRTQMPAGDGPALLAMDPAGANLYVGSALSGTITHLRQGTGPAVLLPPGEIASERIDLGTCTGLLLQGDCLVSAHRIDLEAGNEASRAHRAVLREWSVQPQTGALTLRSMAVLPASHLSHLASTPGSGAALLALDRSRGQVLRFSLRDRDGAAGEPSVVAEIASPSALLLVKAPRA